MKVTDEISGAILSHLAQGKEQTFSALEKTGINPKTLTTRLQLLRQYGLIHKEGRNYVITDKGLAMLQSMQNLRAILTPTFPDLSFLSSKIPNELIRRALARYVYLLTEYFGKNLVCVLLFGSAAKGTMTDKSDLDLLIIVQDWNVSLWERTTELLTIRQQMRATSEYKALQAHQEAFRVQHIPLSEGEAFQDHAFYPDLLVDHVVLFQKNDKARQLLEWIKTECERKGLRKVTKLDGTTYWVATGGLLK